MMTYTPSTPPDVMITAGSFVSREFGDYGYVVRPVASGFTHYLFELAHFDGSRRLFLVDKWCNVELGPIDLDASGDYTVWLMEAQERLYDNSHGTTREEV